jgi:prolyl-tRNA editing enzyme YbaK/EbsC (Cys-tRNA(Pro) deacylase)
MTLPQHLQTYCTLLRQLNITHEVVEHPPVQHHYSEALEWLKLTLADCLPTLVMKADDRFITLVSRADCRLDFKKVKKQLRLKNLRLATPEEFASLTEVPMGTARPYEPGAAGALLEQKIFEKEFLMGGSGSFAHGIWYKTADLTHIPNYTIIEAT